MLSGEESACQCRRHGLDPWVKKIPWRRKWKSTPVFLPGKSHGQRSLAGYSPWGHKRVGHDLTTKQQHFYHGAGRHIFWKSPPNTANFPLHVISPDWFPWTPLDARKAQKQGSSTFWPSGEVGSSLTQKDEGAGHWLGSQQCLVQKLHLIVFYCCLLLCIYHLLIYTQGWLI